MTDLQTKDDDQPLMDFDTAGAMESANIRNENTSTQRTVTETTMDAVVQLLNYAATPPDAKIR
jgi:hypothetical protein